MNQKLCLIGGTGRSGTSILNRVFACHPDMTDLQEWRFLTDPDGIIDFYATCQVWSPYHYDLRVKRLERLLKRIGTRHPLSRPYAVLQKVPFLDNLTRLLRPRYLHICATNYCPNFLRFVDELLEHLTAYRYSGYWTGLNVLWKGEMYYGSIPGQAEITRILQDFLWNVIHDVLAHQQVNYYLEKNTWNILWFHHILELMPKARLVHIYRDPRDVVASFCQQTWMPSDPAQSARIYKDILSRWWSIRDTLQADSFFEVALEALVAEPEKILKDICNFWEIPWHDALLETKLSKPHTGRWKHDFTFGEQKEIQTLLDYELSTLGYE